MLIKHICRTKKSVKSLFFFSSTATSRCSLISLSLSYSNLYMTMSWQGREHTRPALQLTISFTTLTTLSLHQYVGTPFCSCTSSSPVQIGFDARNILLLQPSHLEKGSWEVTVDIKMHCYRNILCRIISSSLIFHILSSLYFYWPTYFTHGNKYTAETPTSSYVGSVSLCKSCCQQKGLKKTQGTSHPIRCQIQRAQTLSLLVLVLSLPCCPRMSQVQSEGRAAASAKMSSTKAALPTEIIQNVKKIYRNASPVLWCFYPDLKSNFMRREQTPSSNDCWGRKGQ